MNKKNEPVSFLDLVRDSRILIPLIQRDYAQGRKDKKVEKIRTKFLEALFNAIVNDERIELDFIYGYKKKSKSNNKISFIPLDGQQRLTTLYLLHWYVALREGKTKEAHSLLSKFTYEVRHSSKEFCNRLVQFAPENLETDITNCITNQPWFFSDWKYDPTISGMLVMLSDIQKNYNASNLNSIWNRLSDENAPIVFYCLPMEKLGLVDSLYIKMNSRGKALTDFETFKSNFSTLLPADLRARFNNNIDKSWSDMFWKIYSADTSEKDFAPLMDEGIMKYIHFITDILAYQQNIEITEIEDLIDKSSLVYANNHANLKWLFDSLDLFEDIGSIPEYFNNLFYIEEKKISPEKSRLFFNGAQTNLLKKSMDTYHSNLRSSGFALGERLMLYAIIIHKMNDTDDFPNRLRILRNLIANSEDELRIRFYKDFLQATYDLIVDGKYEYDESKFNKRQRESEYEKQQFIQEKPDDKYILNQLEDHNILRGNLALFNLNDEFYSFAQAFRRLFSSLSTNYIEISRALMTFGDYSKSTAKSGKKLAYGNRTDDRWRNIFTPSRITDFAPTKKSVNSLLSAYLKESKSAKQIIEEYLITFESNTTKAKPFAYYYIKYSSFHFEKWQYGFYGYWKSIKKYEAYKMNKEQFNGRHWCPFSLELLNHNKKKLSLETDGIPLTLEIRGGKFKMECLSEGYSLKINKSQKAKDTIQYLLDEDLIIENEEIDYLFKIKQDEDGFDIEDRIEKGKELIDIISTLMK